MSSYNKIILLGRLTQDPELRYSSSGLAICSFRLAVNNKYTQNGESKEDTTFIDIVVFGKQGENSNQYLSKGKLALVDGKLQQRSWESQDGQKRSKHEVVAQNVTFMPRQSGDSYPEPFSNNAQQDTTNENQNNKEPINLNNDVPF